jgi:hypothetical protein
MTRKILVLALTFAAGAVVGHLSTPLSVVLAQAHKPLMAVRLFAGPDGQTHSEEVELKFAPGHPTEISKLLAVSSGELHRTPGGNVEDWHRAPRRQYVITLSGHGELEVAGGKKISVGPGSIDLVEDTTGKGHITRVVGAEDRVTLQLPLADQSGK